MLVRGAPAPPIHKNIIQDKEPRAAGLGLLISGLVQGGEEIAQHPAVVDVPTGNGHVVLFSINPVYRGETRGTYSLVLNAILNFDSLNAGRKLAEK